MNSPARLSDARRVAGQARMKFGEISKKDRINSERVENPCRIAIKEKEHNCLKQENTCKKQFSHYYCSSRLF